jgi:hypothetical protein
MFIVPVAGTLQVKIALWDKNGKALHRLRGGELTT